MAISYGGATKLPGIPLSEANICFHRTPTEIELSLAKGVGENGTIAYARLIGFNDRSYFVMRWDSAEEAEEGFPDLVEKFRRGQYRIDIYGDGRVEISVL